MLKMDFNKTFKLRNFKIFGESVHQQYGSPGFKTLKMVLETSLLNTQQYKVYIKSKVE